MNSYEVLIDVNDTYEDETPYQFVFTANVKAVNLIGAIEEALTLAADTYGKANVGEAYEAREIIKTS